MLDNYEKDITFCTYCPKMCRFACPVTNAETRETVTPTAKMNLMELLRHGNIELDSEVADIFYRCAGCLSCRAFCKHRIDVPRVIERARAEAVDRGVQPAQLARHIETFATNRNPYGVALHNKIAELGLENRVGKKADTLYFIGCTTLFHFPETALAIVKLLEAAGIDFAVHGDPEALCCGTPALLTGAHKDFKAAARRVAQEFEKYETVVSGCPSCLAVFNYKYPEFGVETGVKVLHSTELAARLLKKGKIKVTRKYDEMIMYHDPCHLAKYFGIHEAPREIISKLFHKDAAPEFSWNRDKNYCCGGGGLLPVTDVKMSRSITRKRLEEFREHDPDMLVTACPTCERTFHRAAPDVDVRDLIALLADRI